VQSPESSTGWTVVERVEEWNPAKTAIVICDMWDKHWCPTATARVAELAPAMNKVVAAARRKGVLIVHSPSETMTHYEGSPQRRLAQSAPKAANAPRGMASWCGLQAEEGPLPIDDSDGGCDCGKVVPSFQAWTRQIESIEVAEGDAVSDRGEEIWNLMEARGIENVIVMGVHTNMCVLGRPFGIRNLVRAGKNVVLMRDMTDAMYNPAKPPHVSHFRGTDLVVQHVEKHWCPTILSTVFTGEPAFRFRDDRRPRIALVIAEPLYRTSETLPRFAAETLEDQLGFDCTTIAPSPADPDAFDGFDRIREADLVVLSVRRRALLRKEMDALRAHLAAGKPLAAIRTASHAFDVRGKAPEGDFVEWREFDREVLGGNYHGHHKEGVAATLTAAADGHPILQGVALSFESRGSLYKTSPLQASAEVLLTGSIPGATPEPAAWTRRFGESRVFYTSLGHPDDFQNPNFQKLLANAVVWALGG
jgi:type 1 glutamine amidotransferase/nicotinamidase-related amidase